MLAKKDENNKFGNMKISKAIIYFKTNIIYATAGIYNKWHTNIKYLTIYIMKICRYIMYILNLHSIVSISIAANTFSGYYHPQYQLT